MITRKHPFIPVMAGLAVAAQVALSPALFAEDKKPAPTPAKSEPKKEAAPIKDPVATVNGEKISISQLDEALNSALTAQGMKITDLPDEQKLLAYRQILDELITDKLVTKAAAGVEVPQSEIDAEITKIKSQFPTEDEFKQKLKELGQSEDKLNQSLKRALQQNTWVEGQIAGKADVSDEEAQKFYDENKKEFEQPETVKASHILIKVDKDAKDDEVKKKLEAVKAAAARVQKGEDFNAVAKEVSEDPSAKENGGDLGYFPKNRMVPEFAEAAFNGKVGQVSEPVRTDFGWHIIKVTDKKAPSTMSFDEVKAQVKSYLKAGKQQKAVQEVIQNLRDSAKIQNNLPPAAQDVPISKEE